MEHGAPGNLTIRQLYKRVAAARGHRVLVGTGIDVADALEEWYRGGAADGFNIMPQTLPAGLQDFAALVCRSCSAAVCSVRPTKARRCGKIWACHGQRAVTLPSPSRRSNS